MYDKLENRIRKQQNSIFRWGLALFVIYFMVAISFLGFLGWVIYKILVHFGIA